METLRMADIGLRESSCVYHTIVPIPKPAVYKRIKVTATKAELIEIGVEPSIAKKISGQVISAKVGKVSGIRLATIDGATLFSDMFTVRIK